MIQSGTKLMIRRHKTNDPQAQNQSGVAKANEIIEMPDRANLGALAGWAKHSEYHSTVTKSPIAHLNPHSSSIFYKFITFIVC